MKKVLRFFLLITTIAVVINSCRKDETSETPPPPGTGNDLVQATVTGIVLDESNAPLTGVSISADGLSASTDHNGIFVLQGSVSKKRCVLHLSKPGFMNRAHAFIPAGELCAHRISC
jgi:hypothetical protein